MPQNCQSFRNLPGQLFTTVDLKNNKICFSQTETISSWHSPQLDIKMKSPWFHFLWFLCWQILEGLAVLANLTVLTVKIFVKHLNILNLYVAINSNISLIDLIADWCEKILHSFRYNMLLTLLKTFKISTCSSASGLWRLVAKILRRAF